MNNIDIKEELTVIARHLLLNASFIPNLGLLNGKMGIAIFFYHYAEYTKCKRYSHYANELIGEIYDEVNKNTPKDFANGLCGIVYGLTYWVQNDFLSMDDDIFEEIDLKIMEWDISNISDYSVETGLSGVGLYLLCRLYCGKEGATIPFAYSNRVIRRLAECSVPECKMVYEKFLNRDFSLAEQLKNVLYVLLPQFKTNKQAKLLSIKDGLAGFGLRMIMNIKK